MPIEVTAATRGLTTFVESRRPPSPVSIIATSTSQSAKYRKAIAVVASKNVAPIRSTAGVHRAMKSVTYASGIAAPSTTKRSEKSTR